MVVHNPFQVWGARQRPESLGNNSSASQGRDGNHAESWFTVSAKGRFQQVRNYVPFFQGNSRRRAMLHLSYRLCLQPRGQIYTR